MKRHLSSILVLVIACILPNLNCPLFACEAGHNDKDSCNQATVISNQGTIIANERTIIENQEKILAKLDKILDNQSKLDTIVSNQEQSLKDSKK
ncbi:MAG: hypothetical protein K2Y22_03630 [Candidatus Obscuribacterales bacterium]|nr:hypothetical protein [Candidatus Obscuribacterales bacterium]